MIECNKEKCNHRYIGDPKFALKKRFFQHLGYINTNKNESTYRKPFYTTRTFQTKFESHSIKKS